MEKGLSYQTRYINKSLDDNTLIEIEQLIHEAASYEYKNIDFKNTITDFFNTLLYEELLTLREYTGYNYKRLNNLLRNKWDYEENGKLTDSIRKRYMDDAEEIESIIEKFPKNTDAFVVYRGTDLKEFRDYGIESLNDLEYLNGKFIYEEAFTSTSLTESASYFQKDINGIVKNIEIRYIIPPNSNDGIPLITESVSYSPNQEEYVLQRNTLSKVIGVSISDNTAIITAVLIPKKIWAYQKQDTTNKAY